MARLSLRSLQRSRCLPCIDLSPVGEGRRHGCIAFARTRKCPASSTRYYNVLTDSLITALSLCTRVRSSPPTDCGQGLLQPSDDPRIVSCMEARVSKTPTGEGDRSGERRIAVLELVSDTPLAHPVEDFFEMGAFANSIASLISDERTHTPLTFAISGPWGSGKPPSHRSCSIDSTGGPGTGGQ